MLLLINYITSLSKFKGMNKDEIRQKAHVWYMNIPFDKIVAMCAKYYPKTDFDEITWNQLIEMYLKEHPTEAEASKEEETVEEAAMNYWKKREKNNQYTDLPLDTQIWLSGGVITGFQAGALWKKEKDRALINELLDTIKWIGKFVNYQEVNIVISKAEQHLKNN